MFTTITTTPNKTTPYISISKYGLIFSHGAQKALGPFVTLMEDEENHLFAAVPCEEGTPYSWDIRRKKGTMVRVCDRALLRTVYSLVPLPPAECGTRPSLKFKGEWRVVSGETVLVFDMTKGVPVEHAAAPTTAPPATGEDGPHENADGVEDVSKG